MTNRGRGYGALVLTVLACSACSTGSPCTVAPGTPLRTLPLLRLIDIGHGSVAADGTFHFFDSCCSAEHPLEDGGCAAACAPPTMEVYTLGPPYGGSGCVAEYDGTLECMLYAVDGGAVDTSPICID